MRLKNESRNKEVLTRFGRKFELLAFLVGPVIKLVYSDNINIVVLMHTLIEEGDISKFVPIT